MAVIQKFLLAAVPFGAAALGTVEAALPPQEAVPLVAASPVSLEHPEIDPSIKASGGWSLFKQCDPRWSGQELGTCSQTICSAGCAMSSVAMMLNTRGVGVDPSSLNHWLDTHGGYAGGCDIVWGSVDAFGKTAFQGMESAAESEICAGLSAGHGIIANVRGGSHWVLLTGCLGGGVYTVNDPGFNQATYRQGDILTEAVYHTVGSKQVPAPLVVAKAVSLEHPEIDSSIAASEGWTMYKQCDSRWAGQKLGTCSRTICSAGCAMSSVAMMLRTRGVNIDPASLNRWLDRHGGYADGCDIVWGSVDAFGKTAFQGMEHASEEAVCAGLRAGHGIIANVRGGSHWVLLTGCRGNGVYSVNDPGFNQATYTQHEILSEAVYHSTGSEQILV